MVEMNLKGSVQYISDKYYEVICKKSNGKYVIAKVLGKCPYVMEQQITIDCIFVDVDITGEYYELIVKEMPK